MNPILKFLIKQMEDSAVMVEKVARSKVEGLTHDQRYNFDHAFDTYHTAIKAVKAVITEVIS